MKFTIALGLGVAMAASLFVTQGAAGTSETLQAECSAQINLPDSACRCIGEKAEAELNDKQQRMVVAQVTKDKTLAAQLRTQMTVAEMTEAAQFMMDAPGACAGQ